MDKVARVNYRERKRRQCSCALHSAPEGFFGVRWYSAVVFLRNEFIADTLVFFGAFDLESFGQCAR